MPPRSEARSPSRQGRFPDPQISWTIGVTEARRYGRKLRGQDLWLIVAGAGLLVFLLMLPLVFGVVRDLGRDLAAGETVSELIGLAFAAGWLTMLAFGILSGAGSEGEADDQEGLLTIRPPKDVAGGLAVYILIGYLPFVAPPVLVAAAGLAIGVDSIGSIAGMVIAAACMFLTASLLGYAIGLHLKGIIRRSPWLSRLKPVIGLGIIVAYFWLAFTGQLWSALTAASDLLMTTPIGWLGDLALVSTPGATASAGAAVSAVVASVLIIPVAVLGIVHGGTYAWFAEQSQQDDTPVRRDQGDHEASPGERLNRLLGGAGIGVSTRAVAVVVLVRGYRAPLQLAYVLVPFLFLIPVIDQIVQLGTVPGWMPWVVLLYGAWAAGVGFPLNILGNQGATLPRLLTAPIGGRRLLHGYVLAAVIAFLPITIALAVGAGMLADRPPLALVSLAVASVVAVIAGSVLAAGVGSLFPRFSSIELTGTTEAVLPSKTAFAIYSVFAIFATSSIGVLVDEQYRTVVAAMLSAVLPYGLSVSANGLLVGAGFVAGVVALCVPVAYVIGSNRLDRYQIE